MERLTLTREKKAKLIQMMIDEHPDMHVNEMARQIGCDQSHVSKVRKKYLGLTFEKRKRKPRQRQPERKLPMISIVENRIRTILNETPDIPNWKLGRLAHCSYSDAKKWRERIQGKITVPISKKPAKPSVSKTKRSTAPRRSNLHKLKKAPQAIVEQSPLELSIHEALERDAYLAPSDLAKRFNCDIETAKLARMKFFCSI